MKKALYVLFVLALLLVLLAVPVSAAKRASSTVFPFPGSAAPDSGAHATMGRNQGNVSFTIHTSNLNAGNAYSVWAVVFNNPEFCVELCDEGDVLDDNGMPIQNPDGSFGTENVRVSVQWAAGAVVGEDGVGNFGGHIQEGMSSGQILFGDYGLEDAHGAEIHLVIRSHGLKIPGHVSEQIHTFGGGCTPATGGTMEDGNACFDQQFAVFVP